MSYNSFQAKPTHPYSHELVSLSSLILVKRFILTARRRNLASRHKELDSLREMLGTCQWFSVQYSIVSIRLATVC